MKNIREGQEGKLLRETVIVTTGLESRVEYLTSNCIEHLIAYKLSIACFESNTPRAQSILLAVLTSGTPSPSTTFAPTTS